MQPRPSLALLATIALMSTPLLSAAHGGKALDAPRGILGVAASLAENPLQEAAVARAGLALDLAEAAVAAEGDDLLAFALSVKHAPAASAAVLPPIPVFTDLPSALHALNAWYGHTPSPKTLANLQAAGDLPREVQDPVARLVALHLFTAETVRLATTPTGLDVPLLAAARDAAVPLLIAAAWDLADAPPVAFIQDDCDDPFILDLTGVPSNHACDVPLLIDVAGDDTYLNNAGGATGGTRQTAALAVDGAGNDFYDMSFRQRGGVTGGSVNGTGYLLDLGGEDAYLLGVSEVGGPPVDPPTETVAANGAAVGGTGFHYDALGSDHYEIVLGGSGAVNGGAYAGGAGLLVDTGLGSDFYRGVVPVRGGVNGGAFQGSGVLVDDGGANFFFAEGPEEGGSNGAAAGGEPSSSILPPDLGDDLPAALGGLGVLVAGLGTDVYISNGTTQGAGFLNALGLLVDLGGDNTYHAGSNATLKGLAQGAGRHGGAGVLLDLGGAVNLTLKDDTLGQGSGYQGVGLLLRGNSNGATDYHSEPTAVPNDAQGGGAGARMDAGLATLTGPQPDFLCDPGTEVMSQELPPQGTFRWCDPDSGDSEDVRYPHNGTPVGSQGKEPVTCTGLCDTVVSTLLGDRAVDWLGRNHVNATTRGGLVVSWLKQDPDVGHVLNVTLTAGSADEICDISCEIYERVKELNI